MRRLTELKIHPVLNKYLKYFIMEIMELYRIATGEYLFLFPLPLFPNINHCPRLLFGNNGREENK